MTDAMTIQAAPAKLPVNWSNVIGGLISAGLGMALTTYVATQVLRTEVHAITTKMESDKAEVNIQLTNTRDWIKRVDERSASRHDDAIDQMRREVDIIRTDQRELQHETQRGRP